MLSRIAERIDAAPVPLPAVITDAEAWDYTPVQTTGHLRYDGTLHLLGRIHQGRPGAHLLTPLIRGGNDGETPWPILVNRGWVPLEAIDSISQSPEPPDGPAVSVAGVLRLPAEPGWAAPSNDPSANEWLWIDVPAMAAAAGLDRALPLVLTLSPPEGGSGDAISAPAPIPAAIRVDIPDNHLGYALTWFGLAAALLAVYFVSQSRKPS